MEREALIGLASECNPQRSCAALTVLARSTESTEAVLYWSSNIMRTALAAFALAASASAATDTPKTYLTLVCCSFTLCFAMDFAPACCSLCAPNPAPALLAPPAPSPLACASPCPLTRVARAGPAQHHRLGGPEARARLRRQAPGEPDPHGGQGLGATLRQLPAQRLGRSRRPEVEALVPSAFSFTVFSACGV